MGTWNWRNRCAGLGVLSALASLMLAATSAADTIRIRSINGVEYSGYYAKDKPAQIQVKPGDVITLSADLFTESYESGEVLFEPTNSYLEDFIWSASDRTDNVCDASYAEDCLADSDFEVTDNGINFYVPYDMGNYLSIDVRHRNGTDSDYLTLENEVQTTSQTPYVAPTEVVTEPSEYRYVSYHEENVLAGQGQWIYIGGVRYWCPTVYESGWAPYRHGKWSWTSHGWTWLSYDPWGWYTDHYGVWRYHSKYGWVWRKFSKAQFRYHPHTVTFYYHDGHVGWYPYYKTHTYTHGYQQGFTDGYWDGYNAGRHYGSHQHYQLVGFTWISYRYFSGYDITRYCVRTYSDVLRRYRAAHNAYYYGRYPGYGHGATDLVDSFRWLRRQLVKAGWAGRIPRTHVRAYRLGKKTLHYATRVGAKPLRYKNVHQRYRDHFKRKRHRLGSVLRPAPRPGGRPVLIPPTSNHRGVGRVARRKDRSGKIRRVDRRVRTPGVSNPHQRRIKNPGRVAPRPPRRNPGRVTPQPPRRDPGRVAPKPPRRNPGRVTPQPPRKNPGRVTPKPPRRDPGRVAPKPPRRDPGRVAPKPPRRNPGRVTPKPPRKNPGRVTPKPPRRDPGRVAPKPPRRDPGRVAPKPPRRNPGRVTPKPPRRDPGRVAPKPPRRNPGRVTPKPPRRNPGRVTPKPPRRNPGRVTPKPPRRNPGRVTPKPPRRNPGRVTPKPPRRNPGRVTPKPPRRDPGRVAPKPPRRNPGRVTPKPPRRNPGRVTPQKPRRNPGRVTPQKPRRQPAKRNPSRTRNPNDQKKRPGGKR